jgi:hypothetical protein
LFVAPLVALAIPTARGAVIATPTARLPAPITITTGRVTYRIERDARVHRVANPIGPFPRDAAWSPITRVWFAFRHGHLVVGRGHQRRWRSHGTFRSQFRLGAVTVGKDMVAFSYDNNLYLASLHGRERRIARSEFPLGWTSGGLYTYRWHRSLLLRDSAGRVVTTIARWPFNVDFQLVSGSLYFLAHGAVMSADGNGVHRLTSLRALGLPGAMSVFLQSAGPLLELEDNSRLVMLRSDGAPFASTRLREGHVGGISSSVLAAPDLSAVAFTATAGQTRGTESVYVLRAGTHRASPLHTEHITFQACERGATVQWHGRWLLYTASEGVVAAIDTGRTHRTVELTGMVMKLAGIAGGFSAYWGEKSPLS